jgi:cytochrome c oxidase subunit 2
MKKFKSILLLMTILSLVIVLSACGGETADKAPAGDTGTTGGEAQEITITAKNWEFEPKEITVKKGTSVTLTLENKEGFHGLGIPGYDINLKGGESQTFVADEAGEFEFACTIQCGAGHSTMLGKLIVTE